MIKNIQVYLNNKVDNWHLYVNTKNLLLISFIYLFDVYHGGWDTSCSIVSF